MTFLKELAWREERGKGENEERGETVKGGDDRREGGGGNDEESFFFSPIVKSEIIDTDSQYSCS